MTIEYLRNNNLILFEVISGSHAYGTNIEGSDTDIRGVYVLPEENILGMEYIEQINNPSNDITFYEIKRFLQLVSTNNPNILELLNVPAECIIYKHPLFDLILNEKHKFITTTCKMSFGGYAIEQIKKARGLNKKIVNKMEKERKSILDFCYALDGGEYGTIPIQRWLLNNKLKQEYCGLSKIPNMRDTYALFYDYKAAAIGIGNHGEKPNGYKGIISGPDANDVQLSSIPKGPMPECTMSFNKDGYSIYCKRYKEYWDWDKNKNPIRFNENIAHGKNYDGKNLMHCHRLLDMAIEIAQGKGIIVKRKNREKLLSIRRGEYDYNKLVNEAESKMNLMDDLFNKSNLPNETDKIFVNNLLITIRKKFYTNN